LGSAGWVRGRGGTAGQNHSSTKSIARLDVQAASSTAKMADSVRSLPKTIATQAQLLPRQIHTAFPALARLKADCSFHFSFLLRCAASRGSGSSSYCRSGARIVAHAVPLTADPALVSWRMQFLLLPIAPPRRSQSHLFASRPTGRGLVRRGKGRKKKLSVHHHRTNNKQPLAPPGTHVTSIYRTTWLNMHLMGDLG